MRKFSSHRHHPGKGYDGLDWRSGRRGGKEWRDVRYILVMGWLRFDDGRDG